MSQYALRMVINSYSHESYFSRFQARYVNWYCIRQDWSVCVLAHFRKYKILIKFITVKNMILSRYRYRDAFLGSLIYFKSPFLLII